MGPALALRARVLRHRDAPPHLQDRPPPATAFAQLRALQTLANLAFIGEADDHLQRLEPLALTAKAQGGATHDARIAAICRSHGVAELWSAERDFSRFPALAVRNPLVG